MAALLAAVCYLPALNGEPIAEDRALIFESPATRAPSAALASFTHPFWHGIKPVQPYYRPLPVLTWSLERWVLGGSAAVHHATNIALHALNAALAALLVIGLSTLAGGGASGAASRAMGPHNRRSLVLGGRRRASPLRTIAASGSSGVGPRVLSGVGGDGGAAVLPPASSLAGLVAPSTAGALIAGALVAVHPLHSEPVAALYGRPDLLAATGTLLFLNLAVRGRLLLSLLALAGALFSKESALLVPLLAPAAFAAGAGWKAKAALANPRPESSRKRSWSILRLGWPRRARAERDPAPYGRHRLRAILIGVIAAVIVLGAYLLMRHAALGVLVDSAAPHPLDNPLVRAGFVERWLTPLAVAARTARIAIWPDRLCADRGFDTVPLASSIGDAWALAGAVALSLSILLIAILAARRSLWALAATAALLAWLPASNLIVLAPVLMAERLAYMPSIFAWVLAGGVLGSLQGIRSGARGTAMRPGPGGDEPEESGRPGFRAASTPRGLECRPLDAAAAPRGPGSQRQTGGPSTAPLPVRAARFRRLHLRLRQFSIPTLCVAALGGLAVRTFYRASDFRTEISFYESDTRQCPRSVKAHYNLGNVLARAGRHAEAVESFARATAIDPMLAIAHSNRAASFLAMRQFEEAELSYRRALAIDPSLVTARASLAGVLMMMGRSEEALREAEAALVSSPSPSDAAQIRELIDRIRSRRSS